MFIYWAKWQNEKKKNFFILTSMVQKFFSNIFWSISKLTKTILNKTYYGGSSHRCLKYFKCLHSALRLKSSMYRITRVPLIWAVERWDPLTAHIDVCSRQTLIWAVGKNFQNSIFSPPLILMITFGKHQYEQHRSKWSKIKKK